jgi:hypothetical protein
LPCFRYKVTEIRLFKPGQVPGFEWTERWPDKKLKNISTWASPQTRIIHTTEGFSALPLELEVREFIPVEGDVLRRHWYTSDGTKKSVDVPAYAIVNVDSARQAYIQYINQGAAEFFKGWLKDRDNLVVKTYLAAIEVASSLDAVSSSQISYLFNSNKACNSRIPKSSYSKSFSSFGLQLVSPRAQYGFAVTILSACLVTFSMKPVLCGVKYPCPQSWALR